MIRQKQSRWHRLPPPDTSAVPPERRAKIVSDYQDGKRPKKIAQCLAMRQSVVSQILREEGALRIELSEPMRCPHCRWMLREVPCLLCDVLKRERVEA